MTEHRPRIRGRISEDNWARLMAAAKRKDSSQSKIINNALSSYFSFEIDDRRDAQILERLDMMQRHNHRISRDINLLTESFSLYLQYFFTLAPHINASDKNARAARGVSDLNEFIDQLGLKMKSGGKTFKHALEDVLVSDTDFFRFDELELLKSLSVKKIMPPPQTETGESRHV